MVDKLFKLFFCNKISNKSKTLTVLKENRANAEEVIFSKRMLKQQSLERTCLYSYFSKLKGLNVIERQVFTALSGRK